MIKLKSLLQELLKKEKPVDDILFHGTDETFSLKDINLPAHFGSREAAEDIGGSKLMKARVKMKNPIRMYDDQIQVWDLDTVGGTLKNDLKVSEDDLYKYYDQYGSEQGLIELLKSLGYDGIVYENRYEDVGSQSYIVIDKSTISVEK
tara:strand:+ start:34 stop:477 length:444 start_codon:yes stop_codon:yes gene_type:complete